MSKIPVPGEHTQTQMESVLAAGFRGATDSILKSLGLTWEDIVTHWDAAVTGDPSYLAKDILDLGKLATDSPDAWQVGEETAYDPKSVIGVMYGLVRLVVGMAAYARAGPGEVIGKAASYHYLHKHPLILPDAGSLINNILRYDTTPGRETALQKLGYGVWARDELTTARLQPFSVSDYWQIMRRGGLKAPNAYDEALKRALLYPADREQLNTLMRQLLPVADVPKALWWDVLDKAKATTLLDRHGFDAAEVEQLLALAYNPLPAALVLRGTFRDQWVAGVQAERLKRLGFDDVTATEFLELSKELHTRGDLDRWLFAGKITLDEYALGLKMLGLHPAAVDKMIAWPWTPTPPGEATRLLRLGLMNTEEATTRLRATGLEPSDADLIASWPWGPTDLGTMRRLYLRGMLNSSEIEDRLKAGGLRPDDAANLSRNLNDPLPPPQLIDLFRRGEIDEARLTGELQKHGYSAESVEQVKKLVWVLPSPGAVIDWAVKDVFEPDVVEHFGYDEEFPPEFQVWCAKAGIPEDQARFHWWAHWYVPGVGQVMDMLHRIKPGQEAIDREARETWVNDADVDVYLKTQDYPPWWREPLKAISYHPISRIDIRRVYHAGQMDIEDVYNTYRALGYSHYNSTILTEWVKSAYRPDVEQVAVDRIRDAVVGAEIEESEARSLLTSLDVPGFEQDNLIAGALYERERAHKELSSSQVKRMYQEGLIDAQGARDRLLGMMYGAEEVDLLLADWRLDVEYAYLQAQALMNKPTRAQHDTFFEKDVIGEQDWRDGYAALGYGQPYISWYWTLVLQGVSLDELIDRYVNGRIYRDTLRTRLIAEGLTPGQADTAIRHLEEAM